MTEGLRGNCWCEAYIMSPDYPHRPTCTAPKKEAGDLIEQAKAAAAGIEHLQDSRALRRRSAEIILDLVNKLEFHQAWHLSYEEEAKTLRARLATAFEDAAKVAEAAGEPYAVQTNTGSMVFRAATAKIAAGIRALATPTLLAKDASPTGESK